MLFGILQVIRCAPAEEYQEQVPIVRQDQEVNFDGSYKYRYGFAKVIYLLLE